MIFGFDHRGSFMLIIFPQFNVLLIDQHYLKLSSMLLFKEFCLPREHIHGKCPQLINKMNYTNSAITCLNMHALTEVTGDFHSNQASLFGVSPSLCEIEVGRTLYGLSIPLGSSSFFTEAISCTCRRKVHQ